MAAQKMLVTPKGSAEWVKLFTPDTKFNPLGQYSINLKVKEDEAESLTTELNRQVDACYNSELKKNPKLKNKMVKRLPYEQLLCEAVTILHFDTGLEFYLELNEACFFTVIIKKLFVR